MQYARTYKTAVFYIIFIIIHASDLHAAAITNLDTRPHVILVNNGEVALAAGETWRVPGKVKINYHGRDINLEETDEYAIWNNTDFGPQRRMPMTGGSLGD